MLIFQKLSNRYVVHRTTSYIMHMGSVLRSVNDQGV